MSQVTWVSIDIHGCLRMFAMHFEALEAVGYMSSLDIDLATTSAIVRRTRLAFDSAKSVGS